MVSNFPFLVIGLIGLVLCYYGDYFKFRYCGSLLYVQCLEWIKSFIVQSVIIFDILIIACKESFGVGRVFTSVWLLLQSDPHTIIWSQMMLVLCGIACQWVWSCNKSHLLYRMSTAIKMPYFTLIDIFFFCLMITTDDNCVHIDHCNLYHWKDWWAEGNNFHHTSAFGGYYQHTVLEASTIFYSFSW